jgi:hypothetical protein
MNQLITNTMCIEEEERDSKLEVAIEDEEPTGIEVSADEIECSIKKISISILESLIIRFPDVSLSLLYSLVQNLTANQLQASLKVQDNIISLLGILPSVYLKNDFPENQRLDIFKVMEWIISKSTFR